MYAPRRTLKLSMLWYDKKLSFLEMLYQIYDSLKLVIVILLNWNFSLVMEKMKKGFRQPSKNIIVEYIYTNWKCLLSQIEIYSSEIYPSEIIQLSIENCDSFVCLQN